MNSSNKFCVRKVNLESLQLQETRRAAKEAQPNSPTIAARRIAEKLGQIPKRDREIVDRFFQSLLRKHPFGYTLFGNKPVSVADYPYPPPCINDCIDDFVLEQGWDTWSRYQHLFPSNEFAFIKESHKGPINTKSIWLIHKGNTLSAIRDNLNLFQAQYGDLQPEEILHNLCRSDISLNLLPNDLIGILFGYGRKNATQYHLASPLSKRKGFELPGSEFRIEYFNTPTFMCWNEQKDLIISYSKTRKRLREAYKNGDFLEVTLCQWTDPQ